MRIIEPKQPPKPPPDTALVMGQYGIADKPLRWWNKGKPSEINEEH